MAMTPMPTPAPSRTMSQVDFDAAAALHIAALPAFITEANALQTDVNAKQATASAAAVTATDKEILTDADATATAADRVQTGLDRTQTGIDAASALASKNAAAISEANAADDAAAVAAGLASIAGGPVASVNGQTGIAVLTPADIGAQDALVSGTNIKTINGASILGAGDIAPLSGVAAGAIDLLTGANIASAATINLNTATGNRVHITGTTTITAVTLTRGPRTVIFDGILTLTHHATNNNLPGAANITTAAGDRAIYESDGTTVYCVAYTRKNGTPVVAASSGAMILLATLTPTAAANVDFLSTFSATYDNYVIEIDGIYPIANDTCVLRLAVAGVADASVKYSGINLAAASEASLTYAIIGGTTTMAAGMGASVSVKIKNANSATSVKNIQTFGVGQTSAIPTYYAISGSGAYVGTTAVTGFRLYWLNGSNFQAAGKVRVYGITNA